MHTEQSSNELNDAIRYYVGKTTRKRAISLHNHTAYVYGSAYFLTFFLGRGKIDMSAQSLFGGSLLECLLSLHLRQSVLHKVVFVECLVALFFDPIKKRKSFLGLSFVKQIKSDISICLSQFVGVIG